MSIGMVAPKPPVAGSVTSVELTSSELRCSGPLEITSLPCGVRTTPGIRGSASRTSDGCAGRALACSAVSGTGAPAVCPESVTFSSTVMESLRGGASAGVSSSCERTHTRSRRLPSILSLVDAA